MTPKEAVALFGEPNSGVAETCVNCTFKYMAPLGTLSVEREGYIGFVIDFRDGKASEWQMMRGYPSFAPPKMSWRVKIWVWLVPISVALGILLKFLIRRTPVAFAVISDIVKAFEAREIPTTDLPSEFRFITHETRFEEVLEKLGNPSRIVKLPINPNAGLGYALVSSGAGAPAILTFEYDLPYRGAVVVMPEFPFEQQNRIRAVFYQPIKSEIDDD